MKSYGEKANNTLNGQYPSSQVSPMESEADNPQLKINPSKLREFMKRDDIVKKLEHFISNGCGNPRQFSLAKVTNEIIKTLSSLDDELQHEIMRVLYLLFPNLKTGLNVSRGLSAIHELIKMFMQSDE